MNGITACPPTQWFSLPTAIGEMHFAWAETASGPRLVRILLPGAAAGVEGMRDFAPPLEVANIGRLVQVFLSGEAVAFDLSMLALSCCGEFQRRVLLAEAAIPRGWVSTYGRIAAHLGAPGAGRAVGSALARNPFPIVIPCHRAVRSNGTLGGYQGGLTLKRTLLTAEGVAFGDGGRVRLERVWY